MKDTPLRTPARQSPRHTICTSRTGSSCFRMSGWRSPTGTASFERKTWSWSPSTITAGTWVERRPPDSGLYGGSSASTRGGTPHDSRLAGQAPPVTPDDQTVHVLEAFGYTTRQAQFLALVAVHGGYFLRRQFVAFTGRTHGLATVRFLDRRRDARRRPFPPVWTAGERVPSVRSAAVCRAGPGAQPQPPRGRMGRGHPQAHDPGLCSGAPRRRASGRRRRRRSRFCRSSACARRCGRLEGTHRSAPGSRLTTRYFVDKMPWYRETDDARLWIVYVDAEVTLRGFETFLEQYRGLLGALPSGVIYVSPAPWSGAGAAGVRQSDRRRRGRKSAMLRPFETTAELRARIEAKEWAALSVANLQRYRALEGAFQTATFDALYQRWRQVPDAPVSQR